MKPLLLVFIGGGLGSICRYLIGVWLPLDHFPKATLLTNFLACLVIGFLVTYHSKGILSSEWKLILSTGFCGGFSTFSTFSAELTHLAHNTHYMTAALYLLSSLVLGVLGVLVGMWLGHQVE